MNDVTLLSYHVKHSRPIQDLLNKAQIVADYAVKNKNNKKLLTSKYVKHVGLPSAISNQILRQYGRGTIKQASNVNLIIPNQSSVRRNKNNEMVTYNSITYKDDTVTLKPLKMIFRWNPGRDFIKIHQVVISEDRFMITASFRNRIVDQEYINVLGVDLNCGIGRHVAVLANNKTKEVIQLNKQGPNIRKKYFVKRKTQRIKGFKEKRIMKDMDHKVSRDIVNYALKNKLKIVLENLKNIRNSKRKGNGFKNGNRVVNSWSFYRLQSMIEYKSKERGIPVIKIKPHYTSQLCSYCHIIGTRKGENFICNNNRCSHYKCIQNSDVNAAFNICHRTTEDGGIIH